VVVAVDQCSGDSPLTKAVQSNDVQAVRTLVKSGADVNDHVWRDGVDAAALRSANNGSVEIARLP
jgi:hypothetical protein